MRKRKKTAAVYDRWLSTLGGGEQVAFAYAAALRELGYATTMITHASLDREKAERKMGISLKDIEILVLPMMASKHLSGYSEEYDVFINTSYLDYFPNRSKNGYLSIFFPSQIFLTPYEYIKRAIVLPSFTHFFIYPTIYEGFRYDDCRHGRIYKWLGESSSISFNADISTFSIQLFCQEMSISLVDQLSFSYDGEMIIPYKKRIYDATNSVGFWFRVKKTTSRKFTINLPSSCDTPIALLMLTIPSYRYILYNLFKRFFPKWEMRLHGGPGVTKLSDLTSYKKIVTISEFSRLWIKKYWGLDSVVLYPPVHTRNFFAAPKKKNWIVHVGRFFVTGHNKKQLDLIKIFKTMVDSGETKGWEMHFIGSVADGEKHTQYFEQCQSMSKGYPIFFHLDVPFDELRSLLSQSKIYWHATGLDENESTSPILFEHFGITTVEAMASGCVPVVIAAGGQREIVIDGTGFLWRTRDELIFYTKKIIQDVALYKKLQTGAQYRAKYFDSHEFAKRFQRIIETGVN